MRCFIFVEDKQILSLTDLRLRVNAPDGNIEFQNLFNTQNNVSDSFIPARCYIKREMVQSEAVKIKADLCYILL